MGQSRRAGHKIISDEAIYALADQGLENKEIYEKLGYAVSLRTIIGVVGHGRNYGLCRPKVFGKKTGEK